jgi:urea transport system permease protein
MALFAITGATLIGALLLGRWLVTSRFGRVLMAIRDAEQRVAFCGYNTVNYKLFIWTLSAVICGIAARSTCHRSGSSTRARCRRRIRSRSRSGCGRRPRHARRRDRRGGRRQRREELLHPGVPGVLALRARAAFILVTLFMPHGLVGILRKWRATT